MDSSTETKHKVLYTEEQIDKATQSISDSIIEYVDTNVIYCPIFICVLNGAFMFFTELVKKLPFEAQIDFIRVKSYKGQEKDEFEIIKDIELDINNRDIFIVDDICDSGGTFKKLMFHLNEQKPNSIQFVSLFLRKDSQFKPDFYGIELDKKSWLFGHGLDLNGTCRNKKDIYSLV